MAQRVLLELRAFKPSVELKVFDSVVRMVLCFKLFLKSFCTVLCSHGKDIKNYEKASKEKSPSHIGLSCSHFPGPNGQMTAVFSLSFTPAEILKINIK